MTPVSSGPSEAEWQEATRTLAAADVVCLLCHVAPDGDALGSMLAMAAALRAQDRKVYASFGAANEGETFAVPGPYAFLPALDLLVAPEDFPDRPDLLVTFDTGSADRLGSLAGRVDTAAVTLVVDHHTTNTRYGTLHLVDTSAAATTAVVAELLDRLGWPITEEVAAPIYTGLLTDTGSFRYAATTPAVHLLAARLLATGLRPDLISRAIWDTASLGYVHLLGEVCTRAQLDSGAAGGLGMVWTVVRASDLARHGVGMTEVEGVIDVVRLAAEAEVAVVVKEEPGSGVLRVSSRSRGAIDLGAVCVSLGGGGHRFAAGFTSYDDLDTTLARLRTVLEAAPHLPA